MVTAEPALTAYVVRADALTPQEREAVVELGKGDVTVHPILTRLVWSTPNWRVMLRRGDEIVSGLMLVEREIRVGDRRVKVAGVGDVGTLPQWRRRGYAGLVLERAAAFMRAELDADFGHLFCVSSLVPYYGRFGWLRVEGPAHIQAPWGPAIFPEETMVLPLRGTTWPPGEMDLKGLPW